MSQTLSPGTHLESETSVSHTKLKDLWPTLKQTASNWMEDNAMRLSAALSLYTILSLAPLLVITIKVVGIVWRGKDHARGLISDQLNSLLGPQAADAVKPMIDNSGQQGHGVLAAIISTAVLIFSATGVFAELQDSMNTIWHVKAKPNQGISGFIRNRLLSVAMVFGIAFLLLVSMFVSTVLAAMTKSFAGDSTVMVFLLDVAVNFGVVTLLFAAIFKFLPDAKVGWQHVWVGALLTGIMFTIGKYGLTLYFKYGTPTSAFGAAGSLVAVLLWVYYSSFILFFGAEFTKVVALRDVKKVEPQEHAEKRTCPPGAEPRAPRRYSPPTPQAPNPGALAWAFALGGITGGALARHILKTQRRTAPTRSASGMKAKPKKPAMRLKKAFARQPSALTVMCCLTCPCRKKTRKSCASW